MAQLESQYTVLSEEELREQIESARLRSYASMSEYLLRLSALVGQIGNPWGNEGHKAATLKRVWLTVLSEALSKRGPKFYALSNNIRDYGRTTAPDDRTVILSTSAVKAWYKRLSALTEPMNIPVKDNSTQNIHREPVTREPEVKQSDRCTAFPLDKRGIRIL